MSDPRTTRPRDVPRSPVDDAPEAKPPPRDAAERRLAFQAAIIDAIADAVVVLDADHRIIFWNPGAARIFATEPGGALGRSLDLLFPPDRSAGHEPLLAVLETPDFWEGDIRVAGEPPGGSERAFEVITYAFPGDRTRERVLLVWDVTDLRVVSDAVGRLAAVVEGADDAIYTVDRDGRVLTWNAGAVRLTGYGAEEMIGAIGPFDEAPDVKAELRRRGFEAGEAIRIPATRLRTRDGGTVPVSLLVSPVRAPDGRVVALSAVARDERPRLATERELRFRDAILSAMDDAVIATDSERVVVHWSAGAERLFAVAAADVLGRRLGDVAPFRLLGGVQASALVRRVDEGEAVRVDIEYSRPDGTTFIGESTSTSLRTEDGAIVRIGVIRDVTGIRHAAQDSARLAALVEGAGDLIVGTDLDAIIRSFNPAAARALGYTPQEAIGRSIGLYIAPEDMPKAFELRARLVEGGEASAAAEFTYVARNGVRFPVWVVIAPIRDEQGAVTGVSAIAHDLRQLRSLEEQLRQAQKLEAVGRLAGGVAHDFNNLLTAVTGYATLLLDELPPGGGAASDVAQILQAANRAASLTRSLLAFSRGKPREVRLVDLDATVTGVEPMLRRLLPEIVELDVRCNAGASVLADPTELELVLVNLAVNGADAMPAGGRLDIATRTVDLDRAFAAEHLGVNPGPHAELVVRDTGAGMSEEIRQHVFDPFFTTKAASGTGLGLTMVHAYVEQAGGTIWVDTAPGRGTTFRILLPVASGEPVRPPEPRTRPAGGTERLLLVEDDAQLRSLAATVLARAGYELTVHGDPREAAKVDPGAIDLLVTDVVMPGMDGPTLAARLRARNPDLPVLFMSGYTDRPDTEAFAALSAQPILAKPFAPAELLAAVGRALGRAPDTVA